MTTYGNYEGDPTLSRHSKTIFQFTTTYFHQKTLIFLKKITMHISLTTLKLTYLMFIFKFSWLIYTCLSQKNTTILMLTHLEIKSKLLQKSQSEQ